MWRLLVIAVGAATVACNGLASHELAEVGGVPVNAVRTVNAVCIEFGADAEFGASCGVAEDAVSVSGVVIGDGGQGVFAGQVPVAVASVTVTRDGEEIGSADAEDSPLGRFFAIAVPEIGTYELEAVARDGTTWVAGEVEIVDGGTKATTLYRDGGP